MRPRSLLRCVSKAAFKDSALPEVVTAFVTHRCNASCSFCFFGESLNVPVDELTADEWKAVARSLGPLSLAILTGGEPFLRRDLPEIAAAFGDAGAENLAIPTNGYQTEAAAAVVESALASPLRTLCVSLSVDGWGAAHDELRGVPGGFERLLRTADLLRGLRERHKGRLLLHCATVFSAANQAGVETTLARVRDRIRPDSMGLTLVRPPFRGPHRDGLDAALYRRLNRGLAQSSVSRRYLGFGARLHAAKTDRVLAEQIEGRYVSPCYAGQLSAVVLADGRVPLCERRGELMGSLRDCGLDFARLWRDGRARALARRQREERCFCGHECFVTPNILFNPAELARAVLRSA